MQNKPLFVLLALTLFVVTAAAGYYGPALLKDYQAKKDAAAFDPPTMPQLRFDEFAMDFNNVLVATEPMALPDEPFTDLNGKEHRFSDFKGQLLLVNFWATWCLPCVVELPSLQQFADFYKGRITVIGVAMETTRTPAQVARFLETRELGDFAGYYYKGMGMGIGGLPTSVLVDEKGFILYRFEGDAEWTSPAAQTFFNTLLLQKR